MEPAKRARLNRVIENGYFEFNGERHEIIVHRTAGSDDLEVIVIGLPYTEFQQWLTIGTDKDKDTMTDFNIHFDNEPFDENGVAGEWVDPRQFDGYPAIGRPGITFRGGDNLASLLDDVFGPKDSDSLPALLGKYEAVQRIRTGLYPTIPFGSLPTYGKPILETLTGLTNDALLNGDKPVKAPTWLEQAQEITSSDRQRDYGRPLPNFLRISIRWSVQLMSKLRYDVALNPVDVALMMIEMKVAREQNTHKEDNWLDTIGYAACVDDMVRHLDELGYSGGIKYLKALTLAEQVELLQEIEDQL